MYPTLAQKKIIMDCFNSPCQYTAGEWPKGKPLPIGTKLKCCSGFVGFYIPRDSAKDYSVLIVNIKLEPSKKDGHYSATLGDGNVFFHRSKSFDTSLNLDQTPEARWHSWYEEPPEGEEAQEERIERQEENQEAAGEYGVSIGYEVYYRVQGNPVEKVVKRIYSNKNEHAFLKSVSHPRKEYMEKNIRGYKIAPQLYFFSPVIRQTYRGYKKVEFLKDMGENLHEFRVRMRGIDGRLSFDVQEALVHEVLLQYVEQLADENIIHTDIKLMNTCIKAREDCDRPFVITFIDFDDAFIREPKSTEPNPPIEASGTPGALAPELFIEPLPYKQLLRLAQEDPDAYEERLKPDYQKDFCRETDMFALGVMLKQLNLSEDSRFYALSEAMLSFNSKNRPTLLAIQMLLDDPMPYYHSTP